MDGGFFRSRLEIHSPLPTPADSGDIEEVAVGIRSTPLGIAGFALFWGALWIDFLNASSGLFVVFDVKAEVIEARLMSRFLGIGGVQDRQVHFAVRKMDRAILGALHLVHFEHSLVEISQLIRLVGENREMTEFGHCFSSL